MAGFGPDYRSGYGLRMQIIDSGLLISDLGGSPDVATPDVNGNYNAKYGHMTCVQLTSVTSVTLPPPRRGKRVGVAVFSGTPVSVSTVGGLPMFWGGPLDGVMENPFVLAGSGQVDFLGTDTGWAYITQYVDDALRG